MKSNPLYTKVRKLILGDTQHPTPEEQLAYLTQRNKKLADVIEQIEKEIDNE